MSDERKPVDCGDHALATTVERRAGGRMVVAFCVYEFCDYRVVLGKARKRSFREWLYDQFNWE